MNRVVIPIESHRPKVQSDEELMALVSRGSRVAMTTLAQRHMPRVTSFCVKCIGDAAIAEEVVQETFLRIWLHRASYEEQGKLVVWMFTTARNLCRNHARGVGRKNKWLDPRAGDEELARVPSEIDPSKELSKKQEAERALRALGDLPAPMREALLLRFDGGLAYDEIAAVVGVPESTLRSRVHHGLKLLRESLEQGEK
jgi:RNA polymerase sigma-70 factor (ECF subfamily)